VVGHVPLCLGVTRVSWTPFYIRTPLTKYVLDYDLPLTIYVLNYDLGRTSGKVAVVYIGDCLDRE
jgi:hypothetical protein